jgi:hypothetical protein
MAKQIPIADTDKSIGQSGDTEGITVNNWSPQQQTARMLALCEAQMEAATQDSDTAVDTLVAACTDMMSTVSDLSRKARDCKDPAQQQQLLDEINARCTALNKDVAAAVVAFQFYDRLSQRLGHVRYSLSTLALFICDRVSSQHPAHWDKLLLTLGRLYRTAEERAIFDSIANSLSLSVSSDTSPPLSKEMSDAGSIELF